MTADPFEVFREPIAPVAPRHAFTVELKRRIADQLGAAPAKKPMLEVREYTPARLHSLTPYLCCIDAAAAIEWYQTVFDAVLLGDPIIMDDGRVGHVELRVGDSVFMLADEFPEIGHLSPATLGGHSVGLMLFVPDADETYERALANGAAAVRPLDVNYGSRQGQIDDPFGHRWTVSTAVEPDDVPIEDAPGRRFGDVGYVTLEVPDGERAGRFYEALFGWTLDRGHERDSFHIASITPPAGIHGQQTEPDVRLFFRVDDIHATAARVRELGGEVLTLNDYDSGGNAECVDDQGLRFDLFRPRAGY